MSFWQLPGFSATVKFVPEALGSGQVCGVILVIASLIQIEVEGKLSVQALFG